MKVVTPLPVLAATVVLLGVASVPLTPFGFSDLSIGGSVAALIKNHGAPDVVTTDVGHIWTWDSDLGKVRVTTDDDGIVRLFDVLPSSKRPVSFALPGKPPLRLDFGLMTASEADIHYKSLAAFSAVATFPDSGEKADVRGYRLTPSVDAVMLFEDGAQTLSEVFYGDPEFLTRAGFLPASAPPDSRPPKTTAPVLLHQGASDYPPTKVQGDTFVRIQVDKSGSVSAATTFVSSGDVSLDRAAVASAKSFIFKPAARDGVPVASIFFHKETFRTLPFKQ